MRYLPIIIAGALGLLLSVVMFDGSYFNLICTMLSLVVIALGCIPLLIHSDRIRYSGSKAEQNTLEILPSRIAFSMKREHSSTWIMIPGIVQHSERFRKRVQQLKNQFDIHLVLPKSEFKEYPDITYFKSDEMLTSLVDYVKQELGHYENIYLEAAGETAHIVIEAFGQLNQDSRIHLVQVDGYWTYPAYTLAQKAINYIAGKLTPYEEYRVVGAHFPLYDANNVDTPYDYSFYYASTEGLPERSLFPRTIDSPRNIAISNDDEIGAYKF